MPDSFRFVLVTGLSGAGKSQALHFLEDIGYYCVDNLPAALLPAFAEYALGVSGVSPQALRQAHIARGAAFASSRPSNPGEPASDRGSARRRRFAVCVDARGGEDLARFPAHLQALSESDVHPETLFLDSADHVLIHRYSESRRRHPLLRAGSIEEAIRRERELLEPMRARADLVLDTSALSLVELRERIAGAFLGKRAARQMLVTVLSFGFKHGLPPEADLVLDVRFLPNPHYDTDLRGRTGTDPEVRDYALANADGREFIDRARKLLKFLIPRYAAEPKSYLTVAVGCTGGRHRSVAVAHELAVFVRDLGFDTRLRHRDLEP